MRPLFFHHSQKEMPMFCEGVSKRDVLVAAALATKWREPPKDALDTLVLNAIDLSPLDMYEQVEQIPFDTALKRTEATIRRKDGSVFRVRSAATSHSSPPLL
jgi:H+-transporting ATPase